MNIVTQGASSLTRESAPLSLHFFDNPKNVDYANGLLNLMYESKGIGLAAPQVGHNIRLFVMGDKANEWVCMNPVIDARSEDSVEDTEGCLSFPGIYLPISRHSSVVVSYYNIQGEWVSEETLTGMWARCFQHELDHLDGKVFTSLVSKVKLDRARAKSKKILRRRR